MTVPKVAAPAIDTPVIPASFVNTSLPSMVALRSSSPMCNATVADTGEAVPQPPLP